MQLFEAANSDYSYIFVSSLVPIQLGSTNNRNKIYWQNPRPNSVRYCTPIRMRFVKKTDAKIKDEFGLIDRQIKCLLPSSVKINSQIFIVRHCLVKTMVDEKMCNSLY